MTKTIAHVVVGLPVDGPFDYFIPVPLQSMMKIGMRVEVLFHHQKKVGYVVDLASESQFEKLSSIQSILEKEPSLSEDLLNVAKTFSAYYGCSLGEAIEAMLPDYLRQVKAVELPAVHKTTLRHEKKLSTLIYGPNRLNMWNVILEKVSDALKAEKSAIILFSEKKFLHYFTQHVVKKLSAPVFIFDELTSKQEFDVWKAVRSEKFCLVAGLRRTIFAPANNLQEIIIVDEDHVAYKQDQTPFYHVHQVAEFRKKTEGCALTLTAVVPRVETWFQAREERWKMIECSSTLKPDTRMIDLTNYKMAAGYAAVPLQNHIEQFVKAGKKILILMNRKGFSTYTSCQQCGYVMKCPRCDVSLVYSFAQKMLLCHRCQYKTDMPAACPQCHKSYLKSVGTGIERLKTNLMKFYQNVKFATFDNETASLDKDAQIVVATQSILSCEDSIQFDLTALVDFDQEINRADYRSHHKVFSLLINLKSVTKELIFVQSTTPDHFVLNCLKTNDFEGFYQEDLKFRRELGLPPYRHLTALCVRGKEEKKVFEESGRLFKMLESQKEDQVNLSDVHADVYPKWRDKYRYTILLKSDSPLAALNVVKPVLQKFKKTKDTIVTINVDP